jgi:hypothetical protein
MVNSADIKHNTKRGGSVVDNKNGSNADPGWMGTL